jgi:hypothetical protein
MVDN